MKNFVMITTYYVKLRRRNFSLKAVNNSAGKEVAGFTFQSVGSHSSGLPPGMLTFD